MADYYQTAGIKVFPKSGTILVGEETINVRPKTFDLLMMLVTSKDIVSKQHMLMEIWDDVVVDDQVVFQSIKELRKLFSGTDVIKTYPRKGYMWIADVTYHSAAELEPLNNLSSKHKTRFLHSFKPIYAVAFIFFCVLLGFYNTRQKEPVISGSVVVLPVNNNIEDNNQQWVRYGAMDQLIQHLSSGKNVAILNTDYVMEVMHRAEFPKANYKREHIEQIFKVSGTQLVVDTVIEGNSGDYQLVYALHKPSSIEKGVIMSEHIVSAFGNLARIINDRLGQNTELTHVDYPSAFANEILAEAIELKHQGNKVGANKLLEAVLITEANNLTAQRLLVELALDNLDGKTVNTILSRAIPMALADGNKKELIRLQFFGAIQALRDGNVALGKQRIEQVQVSAKELNDWLYLAYASEFNGVLSQNLKQFDEAEVSFNQALDYHQVLQCPLGRSKGFMFLSELANAKGDFNGAKELARHSLDITEQRSLHSYKPRVKAWLNKLESRH
ncbi:winged helix-turn-helix domain-containing protein [Alteromonas sp. 5E99-2]|uniref:winged helix-turn-helix domain-containing protein n=1 Tax=Alteromonas sp. 5E99-2 TaxID=2817683 RepID=UPI001A98C62A|nr:winged helix-turn-helix domain-containing protein [Alteromonas sp. 5E99-2]